MTFSCWLFEVYYGKLKCEQTKKNAMLKILKGHASKNKMDELLLT